MKGMFKLKYKLICIDMDGTLLNKAGEISEKNLDAIKMASGNGVNVAVTTGRLFASANYFADLLGVKTPVIASNGAYIRERSNDKVIYKSLLGYDNAIKIVEILKNFDLYPHFNTYDAIFTERLVNSSLFYSKLNETLPEDRRIKISIVEDWQKVLKENESEILKCIVIDKDIDKIKKVKEEISRIETLEVVSSLKKNFEIMARGVSKGKAVEMLANYYGIHKSEIICIGDNENDLSMIKYAGLGIAMGNAEDFVKESADYITDTNDNDGVAKAIEKFVL